MFCGAKRSAINSRNVWLHSLEKTWSVAMSSSSNTAIGTSRPLQSVATRKCAIGQRLGTFLVATFFTMRRSAAVSATTVELWFAAGAATHQCQVLVGGCSNHGCTCNKYNRPAVSVAAAAGQNNCNYKHARNQNCCDTATTLTTPNIRR